MSKKARIPGLEDPSILASGTPCKIQTFYSFCDPLFNKLLLDCCNEVFNFRLDYALVEVSYASKELNMCYQQLTLQ